MCLNDVYSRLRVGIHLSHKFPIKKGLKQGDVLSPLFFNFASDMKLGGLEINSTHQLLVMLTMVSVHTIKKNTEAVVVASKETGLEVNADITKYTVMSRDQNAGRSNNMKTDNSSLRRAEEFIYLGTT